MSTTPTPTKIFVNTKSAWLSKINWMQVLGFVSMLGVTFGIFDLTLEQQNQILAGIVAVQGVVTGVLKTFFTSTITPESVPPNTMVE